ncbi:STAS domain-containing protein [Oceanobacillus halotolerans]|uniref:STAS domain-containing protein n=1 Tax=Oceanobacillus halotolerans TaxID=2663380 RepID=UPI0013DCB39B|nr:STAS domain-containing protein [Oceanobacillus halotolerans]
MNKLDKALYDYLTDSIPAITTKWLNKRQKSEGSIYSVDSDKSVEEMLRKQNHLTNKTVISAFLDEQEVFDQNVEEWASIVAESRVKSDTPIFEVIHALNVAQETFMEFVIDFIEQQDNQVSKEDVIKWHSKINTAFNQLNTRFAKLYYVITRQQLSSQQVLIAELSTPIIPISDSIAILPLSGGVDTLRMKKIYESLPQKIVETKVEFLFIDLSGITVMDTYIAQQIYQVIKLLSLLGIKPAVSGIQPDVAQTFGQLNDTFKNIDTYSTLKQALKTMPLIE